MQKKYLVWGLGILILILGAWYVFSDSTNSTSSGAEALATCLTQKGMTMYGTEWCPHCQQQKKLFGIAFADVNYVDCDRSPGVCQQEGVEAYPTWKYQGQKYLGTQSLEKLAAISGCPNL